MTPMTVLRENDFQAGQAVIMHAWLSRDPPPMNALLCPVAGCLTSSTSRRTPVTQRRPQGQTLPCVTAYAENYFP